MDAFPENWEELSKVKIFLLKPEGLCSGQRTGEVKAKNSRLSQKIMNFRLISQTS
jgi:hypothetical protein